jgi:hypothetical protein
MLDGEGGGFMGLIKLIVLALAAAFGLAVERLTVVSPVVAAGFVVIVWVVLVHGWHNRAK